MKTRTVVNVFGACICAAMIATPLFAQAPASPAPAQRPASKVTMQGCLERTQAATSTPGATGTAGTNASFILTKAERAGAPAAPVTPPAAGAASSAGAGVTYRLDADASKLTPHVDQRVEISGTLSATNTGGAQNAAASASAGTLKVDEVKMLAASCTK